MTPRSESTQRGVVSCNATLVDRCTLARALTFAFVAADFALATTNSHAEPITFRFDAIVDQISEDENAIFGAINPGDEIDGIFTYDDFDLPNGVHTGELRIDIGEFRLLSGQYNWFWSNNDTGLIGSDGAGDSVTLFCPGGQTSSVCDLAPIEDTFFGWNGSLSFGGSHEIFEDPPTLEALAPAAALRIAETWNRFVNRELLISVQHISGFGSQSILRASIGQVDLIPEPRSIVLIGLSCGVIPCLACRRRSASTWRSHKSIH